MPRTFDLNATLTFTKFDAQGVARADEDITLLYVYGRTAISTGASMNHTASIAMHFICNWEKADRNRRGRAKSRQDQGEAGPRRGRAKSYLSR